MELKNLKQNLFRKSPSFKKEYNKEDLEFEVSMMIREGRAKKKMTQKELAEKLGTKQPSVVRWENGTNLPSLKILMKMAEIFKTHLIAPKFKMLIDDKSEALTTSTVSNSINIKNRIFLKNPNRFSQLNMLPIQGFSLQKIYSNKYGNK